MSDDKGVIEPSKAIVRPSKAIKSATEKVRVHSNMVEHAREIYLAQMARAEAAYFERIEHAMEVLHGDTPPEIPQTNGSASEDDPV